IGYGKDGTTERVRMGDLPAAGEWVRLQVPVASVGLRAGMAVHGVAFTQFAGTSYWDCVGIDSSCSQEPEDHVVLDDDVPEGAMQHGDGEKWQWSEGSADGEPKPLLGARSLRRTGDGLNQDFFSDVPTPLRLQSGDRLFAHVWLDPDKAPRSVQLQFFAKGSWEHRARWGVGAHGEGRAGGADFVAGEVPEVGRWLRLEVALADVGLAPGDVITGWAFTQVGGTVYWDAAGIQTYAPPDTAQLRSFAAWQAVAKDNQA